MTAEENRRRVNRLRAQEANPNRKGGARGGVGHTLGKLIDRKRKKAPPSGRSAKPRHGGGIASRGGRLA